jgi:hypothetical protein
MHDLSRCGDPGGNQGGTETATRGEPEGQSGDKQRECCGRRLTGQRLTGAHALEWLPPHRSHGDTTLSAGDSAVHRPFGLFAGASDLLSQAESD